MKLNKVISLLTVSVFIFLSVTSCQAADGETPKENVRSQTIYGLFDTVSTVYSYKDESYSEFSSNVSKVKKVLEDYHNMFDIYYGHAGTVGLNAINKNAGIAPVKTDKRLIDFLLYAKEIHALTNGRTNVAMGSVLKLWHECRENATEHPEEAKIPTAEALAEAAKHTDINDLIIDNEACTVYIQDPKMSLDVGAVGKGYATEKAAEMLLSLGVSGYVLDIGGNIRAIGSKNDGTGWTAAIRNPRADGNNKYIGKTVIKQTSIVTSGDYERFYTVNGVRCHHIIDPKTNMPSAFFSSVSVITENAALADSLSTALFCMSEEDGRKTVKDICDKNIAENIEVIWVTPDGKISATDGVTLENV